MPYRKVPLVNEEIYHVFNKSIAEYKIFNSYKNYERMLKAILFYNNENPPCKLTVFLRDNKYLSISDFIHLSSSEEKFVKLIAYCIMPTHYHLIIQQLKDKGISKFVNSFQKSYSKFFNIKYKRKGPLWEGVFENILVETDEQLLHLTRYIHLNPVTADLIDDPKDWIFSSYREYLGLVPENEKICHFSEFLEIDDSYEEFVKDRISYQKELAKIKHLII